jgi:hypothetical protein
LSVGDTRGLPLIHKLVKPIKVTSSWTSDQLRFDEMLISETQPQLRAADAAVLGEADATVRQELAGFDMAGRCFDQTPELFSLLICDGGFEVLNFREPLSDERD